MADRISYGPFTLYESEAYKRGKELEATKKALEVEEKMLSVEEKRRATLPGRVAEAEITAEALEKARQKRLGVGIGEEIGAMATQAGGPSLLEATRMQASENVAKAEERARLGAIEQYGIEKGILPTAKIDVGGMSATVPFEAGGERMSDVYGQIYNNMVPRVERTFIDQGYAPAEARRMAIERVSNELQKASSSGKVVVSSADGLSTISYSNEQAMRMWKDPNTPKTIRDQLNGFFGQQETPKASTWINTRLGR